VIEVAGIVNLLIQSTILQNALYTVKNTHWASNFAGYNKLRTSQNSKTDEADIRQG